MQFLQDAPAQTTAYMIAGYTVIFGVIALYLISLYLRRRNLTREMEILNETAREDEIPSPPS